MLIAITVSFHYDDFLSIILPRNAPRFDKWIIVTDPSDTKTISLITESGFSHVEVRFSSLTPIFNKSAAIVTAQKEIHNLYPDAWILLLDSDTVINDSIETDKLNKFALYGATRRYFNTYAEFQKQIPSSIEHNTYWGFFQLYYDKSKYYSPDSLSAGHCDYGFLNMFNPKIQIGISVDHLGLPTTNWEGRKSPPFFNREL